MKNMRFLFIAMLILVAGCSAESSADWKASTPFTVDNKSLYGTEGTFGLMKVNGEADEPEFPVGQGRHYQLFFLDDMKDVNGKKYSMSATHQETGEEVKLYEWDISNGESGAKFALEQAGLWKIDVIVDDELFTSFIIEAE